MKRARSVGIAILAIGTIFATDESLVERARALVVKAEAAEMAGSLRDDLRLDSIADAASALDNYRQSHPDDVKVILLAARLGRLREILSPVTADAPHIDEDLQTAAMGIHSRVDALESLLDHALVIDPHNAEVYYWKARLFGIRTPPFLAAVTKTDVSDFERAIESMMKAVELAPDVVLYRETLAFYLVESERLPEAATTLAGVAGGRHPMYLLLKDLEQVPVPPGAVPDLLTAANLALIKQENGEMRDYTKVRIRTWAIPGPAADIEAFYRARWPGFGFFAQPAGSEDGLTVTGYSELLRWDGGQPVPLRASRMRKVSDRDVADKVMITLIEIRKDAARAQEVTPSAALLPVDTRNLYCVLSVLNRHVVSR